jgi:hypothetical protein
VTQTEKIAPDLRFEPTDDPLGTLALNGLTDRAWKSYGIALHYQAADTGAVATREAMSHAAIRVRRLAAAALERIAADPALADLAGANGNDPH